MIPGITLLIIAVLPVEDAEIIGELNKCLPPRFEIIVKKLFRIDSIINPISGTIIADDIGVVVMDKEWVDPGKTTITVRNGKNPEYLTSADIELSSGQGHETELIIRGSKQ